MKSEICFGKVSGEPLTEYYSEHEALGAAEYSEIQFGHELGRVIN